MKKKRIIALVLCSMFVFSMVASANGTTMTEDMADNILRNNGFTDYMLENIMPDDKIGLALTAQTPDTTVEPFVQSASANMSCIDDLLGTSTYADIPIEDLDIRIIGAKVSTNSVLQYINCFVTSEWLNYPSLTDKDLVVISWSDDNFGMLESEYECISYELDPYTNQWYQYESISRPSRGDDGYFGYHWNLHEDLSKSYCAFRLVPDNAITSNGTIRIYVNYAHKTVTANGLDIGFSVDSDLNVEFSLGTNLTYTLEEAYNQKTITY
ncbi:MAG: hypothetical protein IJM96_07660 [Clostridia bacterium]|nr:hypothetical protein [Clostridia bacterium]